MDKTERMIETTDTPAAVADDDNAVTTSAVVIEPASIITVNEEVGLGASSPPSSSLNNTAITSQIDDAVSLNDEDMNKVNNSIDALRVVESKLMHELDELAVAHDQLQQKVVDVNNQKELCKNDIKDWCTHFAEVNGREPDVKDKAQIKDKYQKYKVLTGEAKTSAVNENDVTAKEKNTKQMLEDVRSKIKELLEQLEKTKVMATVASSSPPSIERVAAVTDDDNAAKWFSKPTLKTAKEIYGIYFIDMYNEEIEMDNLYMLVHLF
jgi:hypothetical protein